MVDVLAAIQRLVKQRDVQVSRHGYRELAADDIALPMSSVALASRSLLNRILTPSADQVF
jgi:hypothetical protein